MPLSLVSCLAADARESIIIIFYAVMRHRFMIFKVSTRCIGVVSVLKYSSSAVFATNE